ncbi:MAG: tripartite tricarboxylate transporter TctB family protein [Clostridia bacterium]|nr:tripartite tricarboxylate transporter TctB family protein [Clostridia bacterium]
MKKTQTQAFANLIGSLLFGGIAIWALIKTFSFQTVNNTYVQPALFSQIMAVGLLIFSVILFIQSIVKLMNMKDTDPLAAPAASINFVKNKGVLAGLAVIALCIFFVAAFKGMGYVLVSAIVAAAIMLLIGKRNWVQIVLVSILVPLLMWLIFYKVLTVNIPMGPLQFLRDLVDMI